MSELAMHVTSAIAVVAELVQSTTDAEYLDDAGRIIGSPAAGPKPEHNGERGGYAQILTLLGIFSAIGFVAWRIRHEMRTAADRRSI